MQANATVVNIHYNVHEYYALDEHPCVATFPLTASHAHLRRHPAGSGRGVDAGFDGYEATAEGVTDTLGPRRDKQDAAGHKTASQADAYNHELEVYDSAGTGKKAG